MAKAIPLFHLEIDGKHFYYRTLSALVSNHSYEELGVSLSRLQKFDFSSANFENDQIIIRTGELHNSKTIKSR